MRRRPSTSPPRRPLRRRRPNPPVPAPPAPVEAPAPEPERPRRRKPHRPLGLDRVAEFDGVDPGDQRLQFRPADFQRQLSLVLAIKVQDVEGDKMGNCCPDWFPVPRNRYGHPGGGPQLHRRALQSSAGTARTASTILGNHSVRSVACRLQCEPGHGSADHREPLPPPAPTGVG